MDTLCGSRHFSTLEYSRLTFFQNIGINILCYTLSSYNIEQLMPGIPVSHPQTPKILIKIPQVKISTKFCIPSQKYVTKI